VVVVVVVVVVVIHAPFADTEQLLLEVQAARETLKESGAICTLNHHFCHRISVFIHLFSRQVRGCSCGVISATVKCLRSLHPSKLQPPTSNNTSEIEIQSALETKSLDEARARRSNLLSTRDAAAAAHAMVESELLNAETSLSGLLLVILKLESG
jgi:hypothetical protein